MNRADRKFFIGLIFVVAIVVAAIICLLPGGRAYGQSPPPSPHPFKKVSDSSFVFVTAAHDSMEIIFDAPNQRVEIASIGGNDLDTIAFSDLLNLVAGLTVGSYTFPTADGSNGQVLKTDGSGALSWAADGTGSGIWTQTSGSPATNDTVYYTTATGTDTALVIIRDKTNDSTWVKVSGVLILESTVEGLQIIDSGQVLANFYVDSTLTVTGNIVVTGTVDGVDIAARDAELDTTLLGYPIDTTAAGSSDEPEDNDVLVFNSVTSEWNPEPQSGSGNWVLSGDSVYVYTDGDTMMRIEDDDAGNVTMRPGLDQSGTFTIGNPGYAVMDTLYLLRLMLMTASYADSILVNMSALADNYILKYDAASGEIGWEAETGGSGEINTLADTGTFNGTAGFGLTQTKVSSELRIRGLIEGAGIDMDWAGADAADTAVEIRVDTADGVADGVAKPVTANGVYDYIGGLGHQSLGDSADAVADGIALFVTSNAVYDYIVAQSFLTIGDTANSVADASAAIVTGNAIFDFCETTQAYLQIGDSANGVADGTAQFVTANGVYDYLVAQSYLTANQTITLSGDLSGSGTTSIEATIAANAVESTMVGPDQINDLDINFGTGTDQVSSDDVTEGSTNLYMTSTQETNFGTAYTHSQDNTQGHSDYMRNAGDTVTGTYDITGDLVVSGKSTMDSVVTESISVTNGILLGSDFITDFTGTNLSVVGGALTASGGSGYWTLDNDSLYAYQDGDTLMRIEDDDAGNVTWRPGLDQSGTLTIGNPGILRTDTLNVVKYLYIADTTTGDVDGWIYFAVNGSWTTEFLKWDDGNSRFELSDDLDVTGDLSVSGTIDGATINTGSGDYEIQDATTAAKGVASFNADDFDVSSGAVSIDNTNFNMDDMADGSTNAAITLVQETAWGAVAAAFDSSYVTIHGGINTGDTVRAPMITGDTLFADSITCDTIVVNNQLTVATKKITGNEHFRVTIVDPNAVYATDAEICICPVTEAALTVTRIDVTCNADPTTELDFDLKWADAFIGLANAAVIDELNTTNGVTTITSGFDDATVAASKCVYLLFNAEPDATITQVTIDVTYDYD